MNSICGFPVVLLKERPFLTLLELGTVLSQFEIIVAKLDKCSHKGRV